VIHKVESYIRRLERWPDPSQGASEVCIWFTNADEIIISEMALTIELTNAGLATLMSVVDDKPSVLWSGSGKYRLRRQGIVSQRQRRLETPSAFGNSVTL
jgi:hypothetical protein